MSDNTGMIIAMIKANSGSILSGAIAAKEAAEAAQAAAETAADSVTPATVQETLAYLGIEGDD